MRNKGAILARLLSPTRYGTLPVVAGDAVVGFVLGSGVADVAAGEGFDGRMGSLAVIVSGVSAEFDCFLSFDAAPELCCAIFGSASGSVVCTASSCCSISVVCSIGSKLGSWGGTVGAIFLGRPRVFFAGMASGTVSSAAACSLSG